MYKYIAIAIVFVCICYIGYMLKKIYKNKYILFNNLVTFASAFVSEIKNSKISLLQFIETYNCNENFKKFLLSVSKNSKTIDIKEITAKSLFLSNSELSVIKDFFSNIGKYDYESTIIFLNRYIGIFTSFENIAKENLVKKGDLYYKLSIMLALAFVLILL